MLARGSTFARGVDGLVRVLDQPLGAGDGPWHVEAMVEVSEVLGGLERFLQRRFREAQCRAEPLELAGIDVGHRAMMRSAARLRAR